MIGISHASKAAGRVHTWMAMLLLAGTACPSSAPPEPGLSKPASARSVAFGDMRPEAEGEDRPALVSRLSANAAIAPVDSNLASVFRGGGCYPPAITAVGLDQLILIDPEWAPVVSGGTVASDPVLIHGAVVDSHGDRGGDFPATHLGNDQNTFVRLDDADSGRLATGNTDGIFDLEWEVGALPDWAWASRGDRIVALGRWIFDCGHPDPVPGKCPDNVHLCLTALDCAGCRGAQFKYRTEMHPPHAVAVLRPPRGALIEGDGDGDGGGDERGATLATRADVFISPNGGSAGDACILTHRNSIDALIGTNCYPLATPVASINDSDFSFDLPLPPRPRHASAAVWRLDRRATPARVPADISVVPVLEGAEPHLAVTVLMSRRTQRGMPTGFAGSIVAAWRRTQEAELRHVRVVVEGVEVRNPLKPAAAVSGREAPGWRMQVAIDGNWRSLSGLENVTMADAGKFFATGPLSADLYLPKEATLRIDADGASSACVETMFGQSLGTNLFFFGFDLAAATACLNDVSLNPGSASASHSWPRFGAREQPYRVLSRGGDGQLCSVTPLRCSSSADCPTGETCAGAFALRYRLEKVDEED